MLAYIALICTISRHLTRNAMRHKIKAQDDHRVFPSGLMGNVEQKNAPFE